MGGGRDEGRGSAESVTEHHLPCEGLPQLVKRGWGGG